jgi:hypothetical protein
MYKTMKEDKKIKMDEKGNFYSRLVEKSFFTENCFRTQFTWKIDPNGTKSKKDSVEDKQSPIQPTVFLFQTKLTSEVLRPFWNRMHNNDNNDFDKL